MFGDASLNRPDSSSTAFSSALPALATLGLAMAAGFTMMGSFSTVQEAAKAEMGLSDYGLSIVQGVSAAVPMLLLSIPIGIAVDRVRRVRLLVALSLLWTLGSALTAFAPDGVTLFVARMLTATGATGALTAALSLAADHVGPLERGRAAFIVTLGKTVGTAAAFALTGWLFVLVAESFGGEILGLTGWRGAHLLLAALGALATLPLLLLREPARRESSLHGNPDFRAVSSALWRRRAFLLPLFAGQIGVVMADAAAGIWAAPVLERRYGVAPGDFAGWMGALVIVTGVVGAIAGGLAADRGQRSGRRGGILFGAVVAAAIGIPAALFPLAPTVELFGVALGVLLLSGTVTGLVMSVALTVLLPNEVRGLCIGAFIAIAGLVGFGIAPTLVAAVSDALGGEEHLPQALAMVGFAVSIMAVAAFSRAVRHAPETADDEPI